LSGAAGGDHSDVVRPLLAAGANVNAADNQGHIRLLKNPVQRASLRPDRSLASEK